MFEQPPAFVTKKPLPCDRAKTAQTLLKSKVGDVESKIDLARCLDALSMANMHVIVSVPTIYLNCIFHFSSKSLKFVNFTYLLYMFELEFFQWPTKF